MFRKPVLSPSAACHEQSRRTQGRLAEWFSMTGVVFTLNQHDTLAKRYTLLRRQPDTPEIYLLLVLEIETWRRND